MKKELAKYRLERARREITRTETLSRRPIGYVSVDEARELFNSGARFFVHAERENLQELDSGELKSRWDDEFAKNITANPDAQVCEFPRGYFYLAEHWKAAGGAPIVVLHYHH